MNADEHRLEYFLCPSGRLENNKLCRAGALPDDTSTSKNHRSIIFN